jgi:endonuclease/exonuclease/phosphatase family metal-dependent hydrolase
VKLVTWNTQWCCGLDGVVSPQRIVDGARALCDFDVLCLQEVAQHYPRLQGAPDHDQPALVAQLLPGFQVFFAPAVDEWEGGTRRRFGNLVATRLPVAKWEQHLLPYPADGGVRSMPRVCAVLTVLDPQLGPVRVMTTHLEYYSARQRMAQAKALRELHAEYCEQAASPPELSHDGSPFQSKVHTANAVLCGDFNLEPAQPEYAEITAPFTGGRLWDCWTLLNGTRPHAPTFRLFDRTYGPDPVACDFVFVSDSLKGRVQSLAIDEATKVSDHQPVAVEIG